MKLNLAVLLLSLLLTGGAQSQSPLPPTKLEIRLINGTLDGQHYAYLIINQFLNTPAEKPVELALDRQKHHAGALLICNHLETHPDGVSQNLKVFQIQLFQPQQLRLSRDLFASLPADYTLPELSIIRTK